jgi:hypothetical protein|tara:strand:+ start:292 stop:750 length:459 start_codon:yes stop_codon:yes gene_type:complete
LSEQPEQQHDIEELKSKFLNREFEERKFDIIADETVEYAITCGETGGRFIDPEHPDFQAPATYPSRLAGRATPEDFPDLGGMGMDAGKGVEPLAPIRPGQTLTGKSHLHDIYTKTGRSGRMIFLVTRMELFDESGTHVANSDTRTVIREKIK